MTPVLIVIIVVVSVAAIAAVALLARAVKQRNQADTKAREATAKTGQLETELAATTASHEARIEEMAKTRDDLDAHFKGIAAEITQTNQEAFLKQAKEQFDNQRQLGNKDLELRQEKIGGLLKPIAETLKKFESHVGEIEEKRAGAYQLLHNQVSQLHSDTMGLREILRSSPARGKWGEQTLRNVLEVAGMREHIDFVEQASVESGDGEGSNSRRPDAVVHIPGGLEVVIDAKAPFDSYYQAHDAKDDDSQQTHLDAHAKAVMLRAKELHDRDYTNLIGDSPDFVVMFVPTDPILDAAMDVDPKLWETAWTKHDVLIATPGLLVAFLRTVAAAWQQQDLQNNAKEITDEAIKLYSALRTFTGHVTKVGKELESAVLAHNKAIGSLESRVLPPARKLEDLGPAATQEKIGQIKSVETSVRSVTKPELMEPDEPTDL